MKKEVLLAVILGLIVGLVITYGVYNARKAVETIQSVSQQNEATNQQQIPVATDSGTLVLSSPEDNSITATEDSTVIGTTQPRSNVVVFVNNIPLFSETDTQGAFQVPVTFEAGSNIITVFSIDREGKQAKQERTVVLSSANLDITESTPSATATSSAQKTASASASQDVQQNIKDRIEKVLEDKKGQPVSKPTAYVGSIDRVTSEALTLNTHAGNKIVQIKPYTIFVDAASQKTIKQSDLEIGSYAIVMGYMQEGALEARRVVMSKTTLYPKPMNVIAGTFKSIEKSLLHIVLRTGKDLILSIGKSIRYENIEQDKISVKDVEEGDPIITILDESNEGTPSASLLHLLVPLEEKGATVSGKTQ